MAQLSESVYSGAVRLSSARIMVVESDGTKVDMGVADNITIDRNVTNNVIEWDNTAKQEINSNGNEAILKFDWGEFDFMRFSKADNGITYTAVAGALQAGVDEIWYAPAQGSSVILEHKNANNTAVTVNSVTGASSGLLTVTTDYTVTTDSYGRTLINLVSGGASVLNEKLTINIDYTPDDAEAFNFVSSYIQTGVSVNVVSVAGAGKVITYHLTNMKAKPNISFKFPSDHKVDKNPIAVEMTGEFATSTTGHAVLDEQAQGRF